MRMFPRQLNHSSRSCTEVCAETTRFLLSGMAAQSSAYRPSFSSLFKLYRAFSLDFKITQLSLKILFVITLFCIIPDMCGVRKQINLLSMLNVSQNKHRLHCERDITCRRTASIVLLLLLLLNTKHKSSVYCIKECGMKMAA